MRTGLARASGTRFDVAIIGGGVIGLGAARDAALRGLRVALFEQRDFCWGTTARSTRLIHGGLRYLEQYDFGLVREDLRERELLLHNAPHLVRPLPFVVPIYRKGPLYAAYLRAGMVLYDVLSYDKSLPNHRFLSRNGVLAAEPNLDPDGLEGAAFYFDAQAPAVERLGIENAVDADALGAELFTHTRVVDLLRRDGRVSGVRVEDTLTGETAEVEAAVTLNATGPWADEIARLARPARRLLRRTKGIHLVTPRVSEHAVVLFADDGRLFFVVPWLGYSYIGTTDTDWDGEVATVRADGGDVSYLLAAVRRAFPHAPLEPVHYATAGVRALVRAEGVHESAVSRKHLIWDHEEREGIPGLVTALGGKLTAYRGIAEDAVDAVCHRLGNPTRSETATRPLPGAVDDFEAYRRTEAVRLTAAYSVDPTTAEHLLDRYGGRAGSVLALSATRPELDLTAPIVPGAPDLRAEVVNAVEREGARTVGDVLRQRTALGWAGDQGRSAAEPVAALMARLLGCDRAWMATELVNYAATAALERAWHDDGSEPAARISAD